MNEIWLGSKAELRCQELPTEVTHILGCVQFLNTAETEEIQFVPFMDYKE